MIPKKTKRPATKVIVAPVEATEFMVLGECEGTCEVGTALPDRRSHCRRRDTVFPMVYLQDGTRDGTLVGLGRTCMKHLPDMIALVLKETPGGNGKEFRVPRP